MEATSPASPPAAASASTTTATSTTTSTQETAQYGEYVAVHHCGSGGANWNSAAATSTTTTTPPSLRNCIFLSWSDAAPHLQLAVQAQYQMCDTLAQAERYLRNRTTTPQHSGNNNNNNKYNNNNNNNNRTRGTKRKAFVAAAATLRTMNQQEDELEEEEVEEDDVESHNDNDSLEEEEAESAMHVEPAAAVVVAAPNESNKKSYQLPKQWKIMFQQLAATAVDGTLPQEFDDNPKLKAWVKRQHVEYDKLMRNEPKAHISNEQVQLLQSIGFVFRPELTRKDEEWNHEFNRRILQLEAFTKANNGDCRLNPSQADKHRDLYLWTMKLKREHVKLEAPADETTPKCRLTPEQLQRLTHLGFAFRQNSSWESRLQELAAYIESGKNINAIPASQPELKMFVRRQRCEYRSWMEGLASTMTQERVDALEQIGFDFRSKRRISFGAVIVQKSWDERYRELLDYKKQHGDTCVPFQSPGGLGHWVVTQRKNLKQFFSGEKSSMNAERVSRLTAIGFIVDVHDYRRRQKLAKATNAGTNAPNAG